jgi:hypothetical protein
MGVGGGAQYNTFEGNLIAHNIWQGVRIEPDVLPNPTPTSDNIIQNNQIIENGGNGVEIMGGPGITYDWVTTQAFTIPDKGARHNSILNNNISSSGGIGVVIDGIRADGNLVYGNSIANNTGVGVQLSGGAQQNCVGGTASGQANSIHDNSGDGVMLRDMGYDFNLFPGQDVYTANSPGSVQGSTIVHAINNAIRGNSIYHNGDIGIDLNQTNDPLSPSFHVDGFTANDSAGHEGPNSFQNFPVLSAAYAGASTRVIGTIASTASAVLTLDFYADAVAEPSGFAEGQRYLGSTMVTTDASGNAQFDVTLAAASVQGEIVTATATNPSGNTSEFSLGGTVSPVPYTVSYFTPVSLNRTFKQGSTIPIKLQLLDAAGIW